MSEKTSCGLYIDRELLDDLSNYLSQANCRTRNEFIIQAVRFYLGWLRCKSDTQYLTPALESVIDSRLQETEDRLLYVLHNMLREASMMMHVLASICDLDQQELNTLRKTCIKELQEHNGRYRFEDAVRYQKG